MLARGPFDVKYYFDDNPMSIYWKIRKPSRLDF